ncbi:hypothetical protein [Streptomyces sp. NPDC058374]|uniref:hypothetical protein n=1 Tax=unclassified Streptomyces TaxID=2593676 RepID=UPI003655007D
MPTSASLVRASAAAAVLALGGVSLAGASAAVAAPGDSGDIRIHKAGTPAADSRDETKVCKFRLAADNFETVTSVSWTVAPQPPLPTKPTLTGTLALTSGKGGTSDHTLPEGQYRLSWTFPGGVPKQKLFTVNCPLGADEVSPSGAVPAGGGGAALASAEQSAFAGGPLLVAAAAGTAGLILVRRARRRADGAA